MDPVTGRFLSNDPVAFSPGQPQMFNRYSYTLNDPVNMTDPDGKIGIAGFVLGAAADVAFQVVVEGKSINEINVGSALVSGVAGATGLGAVKQVNNVRKAAKNVKTLNKAAQKSQNYLNNKLKEGSNRKIKNADFRLQKATENLREAAGDAAEAVGIAVGATAGAKVVKEVLPDVTVGDVAEAAGNLKEDVVNAVERSLDRIEE